MSTMSAGQLALLRTHPQEVELNMSIYRPRTIMSCRVNNVAIAKGARAVAYDGASGSYTAVKYGMTMLVGSTAGASDKGTIRVRSATATVLTVAENSHIQWANDLYLTILYFFDIVPVFPRIVNNPADIKNPIFYKDYDIAYTNQNLLMGTLICMGTHRAAEIENGSTQIYYSASGTYNVNASTLTYAWEFEGGLSGTSTALTPGYVTYTTPGNYVTKLTATSANGAVDTSYRYIIINEPGGGVRDWTVEGIQGSRDAGGYTANIVISSPLDFTITPGTAIVITSKEWYGGTQQNIGNHPGQESIFFVGYVLQNTITYSYDRSSVSFQVGTISEIMKLASGFAISVEEKDNPRYWYQINNLNLKKAIYHFWRWHSTVLLTTDVQFIGADFMQQFFDSNKESLFDAVSSSLKSTRYGELVSDMTGKLWAEISVPATPSAIAAFPSEFTIGKDDWIGEPSIQEAPNNPTSYMEMGGIVYNGPGVLNSFPLLSCAPGPAPTNRGKSSPVTGLSIQNQTQLNALVGDIFWAGNALYPTITMSMRGAFRNFDIAPQKSATIVVDASDTSRSVAINGTYYPSSISWDYNHETHYLKPNVTFNAITDGPNGETIVIPPNPNPGYNTPTVPIPTIPSIPFPSIPIPGGIPAQTYSGLFFVLINGQIWYTSTIDSAIPVWKMSPAPPVGTHITDFDVNIYGQIYEVVIVDGDNQNETVYKGQYDGVKTQIMGENKFRYLFINATFNPTGDYILPAIGCNPDVIDEMVVFASNVWSWYGGKSFLVKEKGGTTNPLYVSGGTATLSYSVNSMVWVLTYVHISGLVSSLVTFSYDLTDVTAEVPIETSFEGRHIRAGLRYDPIMVYTSGQLRIGNGHTISSSTGISSYDMNAVDLDASGQIVMFSRNLGGGSGSIIASIDGAKSFTTIWGPSKYPSFVCNLGGSHRWLFQVPAGGGNEGTYVSADFGSTWVHQTALATAIGDASSNIPIILSKYLP